MSGVGIFLTFSLSLLCFVTAAREEFKEIHMTRSCNTQHTKIISARFETNYGLTYENLMNCYTHLKAESGKRFFIQYKRFEIEEALGANCVDKYNIYDGSSESGANFHGGDMCGTYENMGTINTTAQDLYITMETDNTAVARGVELVITAFYNGPCQNGDYNCSNGICIDPRLECDYINHCGDNSDEVHCTEEDLSPSATDITMALAIGCGIGGLLITLIVVIVVVKVYQYYQYLKFPDIDVDNDILESGDPYRYPVTDVYSKYDIGYRGRRSPETIDADDLSGKPDRFEEGQDNKGFLDD